MGEVTVDQHPWEGASFSTVDLASRKQTTYDGWLNAQWQRVKP